MEPTPSDFDREELAGLPGEALRAIQPHRQGVAFTPDVDAAWKALRVGMAGGVEEAGRAGRGRKWSGDLRRKSGKVRSFGHGIWQGKSRHLVITGMAALVAVLAIGVGRAKPSSGAVQRYRTAPGQRLRVQLADGSHVTLAPATILEMYPDTITVSGAAFFQVVPRVNRPFVVRTHTAIVRVLGTTFVTRQYPSERASHVVVEDGRVMVQPIHSAKTSPTPVILTAGMVGLSADSSVTVLADVAPSAYTGWVRGQLTFAATPLPDVILELSRVYGTDIRLTDARLARETLTLAVSTEHESLPSVLAKIGLVTDAHYVKVRDGFLLVPGRRADSPPRRNQIFQPEPKTYGR